MTTNFNKVPTFFVSWLAVQGLILIDGFVVNRPTPRLFCRPDLTAVHPLVRVRRLTWQKFAFLKRVEDSVATSIEDGAPVGTFRHMIVSSVTKPNIVRPYFSGWERFVPKLWEVPRGVDVGWTWNPNRDKSQQVARLVLDEMLLQHQQLQSQQQQHKPTLSPYRLEKLQEQLASWMDCFASYCQHSLKDSCNGDLTLRIVATRGRASTKCPRWHQDHVPFRWIQSLVGPGCQWVDPVTYHQPLPTNTQVDLSDDADADANESTQRVNARRLGLDSGIHHMTHQAQTGEAVLLCGNAWHEAARHYNTLPGVLHKSPSGIPSWQGRLLLTMDVMEKTTKTSADNDDGREQQ